MEKHRIFIVEDDPKIASLLADTLRKYQYDVETVQDFEDDGGVVHLAHVGEYPDSYAGYRGFV